VIIDSSALVAIFTKETDWADYVGAIARATLRVISAPSLLEATIVLKRKKGDDGVRLLHRFIKESNILIAPFTEDDASIAFEGFCPNGCKSGPLIRVP
jgi:ribonuclease VapC